MRFLGLGTSIFLLVLMMVVVAPTREPAQAATAPAAARKLIEELGARMVPILADDARSEAVREAQLKALIKDAFELSITGRFVLGKFWRRTSAAQREEYLRLFAEYILTTTARRFSPFRDVSFKIVDTKAAGKRDILVKTLLIRPGNEVAADWRVRKVGDRHRLIDVNVAGISLAVTQRQDFAAVITSKGIDGLLENLRAQVADSGRSAKAATQ